MGWASNVGGLVALDVGVHSANSIFKKRKGWHGDSLYHSMARRGIKTGRYSRNTPQGLEASQEAYELRKERREHPSLSDHVIKQIVKDHTKR